MVESISKGLLALSLFVILKLSTVRMGTTKGGYGGALDFKARSLDSQAKGVSDSGCGIS